MTDRPDFVGALDKDVQRRLEAALATVLRMAAQDILSGGHTDNPTHAMYGAVAAVIQTIPTAVARHGLAKRSRDMDHVMRAVGVGVGASAASINEPVGEIVLGMIMDGVQAGFLSTRAAFTVPDDATKN